MHKSYSLFWPLVALISVAMGGVLYVDYRSGLRSRAEAVSEASAPVGRALPEPRAAPEVAAEPSPPQAVVSRYAPGTYRCLRQGRTTYTDKPELECEAGAVVVPVSVTSANAGFAPAKPYQQQLADLERTRAAEAPRAVVQAPAVPNQHENLCNALWADIQRIDSLLRQPHSAGEADWWNQERKRISDRRYAERC